MKKFIFTAAFAAAVLCASCQKQEIAGQIENQARMVDVSLSVNALETRATGLTDASEVAIHNVQYFVFSKVSDTDHSLNVIESAYKTPENAGGSTERVTLSMSGGPKIVRAVVNCPTQITLVRNEGDLENRQILLPEFVEKDGVKNGLMMEGRKEINVSQGTGLDSSTGGAYTATVDVSRMVSRISIEKVTPAYRSDYYASKKFVINNIWVVNAPADTKLLSGVYTPQKFFNKGNSMESGKSIAGDAVNVEVTGSYMTPHTFYTFPGVVDGKVLLCVEVTLGDPSENLHYYYSIDVAKRLSPLSGRIEANKKYTISELKIRMPGSTNPNVIVEKDEVEIPSLTVAPWGSDATPYTEEI